MTTTPRARRLAAGVVVAASTAMFAAVVLPAGPAAATGVTLHRGTKTTIARGIQRWSVSWTNNHGYQRGYLMSIDLTVPGVSMRAGLGGGMVNVRETTQSIANRTGAIGGINGDLFKWDTSLPWGGVGSKGIVFKTPHPNRPSQFYVTSDGRVGIGALNWAASVTQVSSTGRLGASHDLFGINTLEPANNGRLTLFTPMITSESLRRCPAVTGSLSGRTLTVERVYPSMRRFDRLAPGKRMLAACGPAGQWLLSHAPHGQHLRVAQSLTTTRGTPVASFISGERTLRMGGRHYYDRTGFHTSGINPEAAACVSRDHEHVLLIAVDGWIGQARLGNGITLSELDDLAAALHCYSTVVFDGGGSTTMVERRSGVMRVVNQMPSFYGQRPVTNALLVFKS